MRIVLWVGVLGRLVGHQHFVEPLLVRVEWQAVGRSLVLAQVPFAEMRCPVAVALEDFRQRRDLQIQTLVPLGLLQGLALRIGTLDVVSEV